MQDRAPALKVLHVEKRAEEREREEEKGTSTGLKEIRTMLCKIMTAVSVFIGCFSWLRFFSNCCSYEQEGLGPGQALWRWEEATVGQGGRRGGQRQGLGSELRTVLEGHTSKRCFLRAPWRPKQGLQGPARPAPEAPHPPDWARRVVKGQAGISEEMKCQDTSLSLSPPSLHGDSPRPGLGAGHMRTSRSPRGLSLHVGSVTL